MALNVTFRNGGPKLAPADLTAFEHETGLTLPADYKAWLLQHNGGFPETPIGFRQGEKVIKLICFHDLLPTNDEGLRSSYRRVVIEGYVPGYLPIALPSGDGDHLYLACTTGVRQGLFTSKEIFDDDNPVGMTLFPLAGSFQEFWDLIVPFSEDGV
ncbi:MAG: SMI1/KNR4 family protein [Planctomycetaceae bacterium]